MKGYKIVLCKCLIWLM